MPSNTLITPQMIATEALIQLENNLVMGQMVYRDYESQYTRGFKKGATLQVRRPVQYTVRSGSVAQDQDTVEGYTSIVVDTQEGVDIAFSSTDLTLKIEDFSDRYIKPAMIQLSNSIDRTLMTEAYKRTYNWAGTAGQTINSFADFIKGPERLDNGAVPNTMRKAVLSPTDYWGMVGNFGQPASTSMPDNVQRSALERAKLGVIGGVDVYQSQNVIAHTVGAHGGTPLVDGGSQNVAYTSVDDSTTWSQTLVTDGWTTSSVLKAGDVFTISGVYAVNPVSKATLSYLQQFVLISDVTTNANAANDTNLTISPPIITSGAYQTVSAAPANDATITYMGTASTNYDQNLVFHPNAFALAVVPMAAPAGNTKYGQYSRNGFSVRYIEDYDSTNDMSRYRFDVLYGVKAIDPRLATRLSGTG